MPAELKLWRDYLFLTREMGKCLEKQDFALFLELLEQRERLQGMIEKAAGGGGPTASREAREELLVQIRAENEQLQIRFRAFSQQQQHRLNVSKTYDSLGQLPAGGRLDRTE
ncbi:MAG: hypothetical protein PHC60_08965 [Heliobacteriaceae bacterium]|nr:hypothetical protein [Heliobacteriaceae bacterium]MDD4588504.1 hypothetical protein [Heliobacteriaceae bacterium]